MTGVPHVPAASAIAGPVEDAAEPAPAQRPRPLCPLVFVPGDHSGCDAGSLPALDAALAEALAWWRAQLGVQPFEPEPAVAIAGRRPAAAYACETRERIGAELARYFPDLAAAPDGVRPASCLYLVYAALADLPYRCGGNGTSAVAAGGPPLRVVQASGALRAFALGRNSRDPETGGRAAQIGALAHELGHALGLPHPADPTVQAVSLMWSWWRFPGVGLSPSEVRQALGYAAGRPS